MVFHATEEAVVPEIVSTNNFEIEPSLEKKAELSSIENLERAMLSTQQVEIPLFHAFSPGVYLRQVTMPSGTFVIGHQHKTEHFNIVLSGRASVFMDGMVHEVVAPAIIKSNANVRKLLFIHETMIWATIHPTDETDLVKLEDELIVKSDAFKQHEAELCEFKKLLLNNGGIK